MATFFSRFTPKLHQERSEKAEIHNFPAGHASHARMHLRYQLNGTEGWNMKNGSRVPRLSARTQTREILRRKAWKILTREER